MFVCIENYWKIHKVLFKMKLKQRVLIFSGLSIGLVFFGLLSIAKHISRENGNVGVPGEAIINVKDTLKEREDYLWDKLLDDQQQQQKSGGALPQSIKEIRSHLAVMRKDLDISNHTSNGAGDQNINSAKSKQKLLQDYINRDPVFQENAEDIVEIAKILQENGHKSTLKLLNNNSNEAGEKYSLAEIDTSNADNSIRGNITLNYKTAEAPFKFFANLIDVKDNALMHFELPKNVYVDLQSFIQKEKVRNKPILQRKGKTLKVYASSHIK